MKTIRLLIKFKMNFDDFNILFDDYADICDFGELIETQNQSNDRLIFNIPKQAMLSPPISISSSKLHINDSHNDSNSDERESNFLRRMNQTVSTNENQTNNNISKIGSLIISKRVPSKCSSQFSKVKLKLEKQTKFDQNFMKRATNRRSIKNQKKDETGNCNWIIKARSETKIEYTETCEVW